jgi:hypothetical protein
MLPMPLTSKEKQEAFRARIKEQGLSEVRGIFLPPDKHDELKQFARKLMKRKKVPNPHLPPL